MPAESAKSQITQQLTNAKEARLDAVAHAARVKKEGITGVEGRRQSQPPPSAISKPKSPSSAQSKPESPSRVRSSSSAHKLGGGSEGGGAGGAVHGSGIHSTKRMTLTPGCLVPVDSCGFGQSCGGARERAASAVLGLAPLSKLDHGQGHQGACQR